MKEIEQIESVKPHLKVIQPKLDIKAKDWNKEEKDAIAAAYFEITKVSTGRGRPLDTGCASCVDGAVNIINNYVAASAGEVVDNSDHSEDVDLLFAPSNTQWRKNHDSINAAAKELEYTFTETEITKGDRIAALEAHMVEINK